jgi:hypothetical protein
MNLNLTKLPAAAVLALAVTASAQIPAHANSVTQPGETVGVGAGFPLVPGWYFIDTVDWGVRDTSPNKTAVGVNIPVIAWSTQWTFLNARVQLLAAFPTVEVGVVNTNYQYGFFNPFFAGQLAWDLGGGWGFSYALGAYFRVDTPVAFDTSSLNQRFALSYTLNGWNLTANLIWGIQDQSLTSTVNTDFLNLDLTATHKFGNWELGAVGFFSTDLNNPCPVTCAAAPGGYAKKNQFALGGLVGYNFGPVILQGYVTTDVSETNYGGRDTRIWGRIIIPVLDPTPSAPTTSAYRR